MLWISFIVQIIQLIAAAMVFIFCVQESSHVLDSVSVALS